MLCNLVILFDSFYLKLCIFKEFVFFVIEEWTTDFFEDTNNDKSTVHKIATAQYQTIKKSSSRGV